MQTRWLIADLVKQRRRVRVELARAERDRRALQRAKRRFVDSSVGRPLGLVVCFGTGFLVGLRRRPNAGSRSVSSTLMRVFWIGRAMYSLVGSPGRADRR